MEALKTGLCEQTLVLPYNDCLIYLLTAVNILIHAKVHVVHHCLIQEYSAAATDVLHAIYTKRSKVRSVHLPK